MQLEVSALRLVRTHKGQRHCAPSTVRPPVRHALARNIRVEDKEGLAIRHEELTSQREGSRCDTNGITCVSVTRVLDSLTDSADSDAVAEATARRGTLHTARTCPHGLRLQRAREAHVVLLLEFLQLLHHLLRLVVDGQHDLRDANLERGKIKHSALMRATLHRPS